MTSYLLAIHFPPPALFHVGFPLPPLWYVQFLLCVFLILSRYKIYYFLLQIVK